MYIESEDYRNVWELAHQWAGFDSGKTVENKLPDQVELNLKRLTAAIIARRLKSRTKSIQILIDDSFLDMLFGAKHLYKLFRCRSGKAINKDYLETLFVRRPDFLEWCQKEQYPNSDFWVLTQVVESNKISNRPKNEAEDKAVCRAIAKLYWDIDPNIHPSHMANSKAISIYGNGKLYKDGKTIKSWISDLDPLLKSRKTGRPEAIIYKVDLKNGGLLP